MRRLFISALHLDTPTSPQFLRFAECLAAESRRVDEIYVLGDLVEMWIGDDDDNALAIALTSTLQLACKQCRIYLMHGNRDFLFGKQFANQTGVTIIDELHEPKQVCCCPTVTSFAPMIAITRLCGRNFAAKNGNPSSSQNR